MREFTSQEVSEFVSEYQEAGFVKVSEMFDANFIEEIKNQVDKNLADAVANLDGRDINLVSNKEVNSVHCAPKVIPEIIDQLKKVESLAGLVKGCLGTELEFRNAELFLKPAGTGLKSPMHQDDFYWCISDHNGLTVWVALEYAGKENGGVSYVRGSHKKGLVDHVPSFAPGSSQMVDPKIMEQLNEYLVTPELQAGDVLIHHALTIHGSAPNKSERSRRGLTLQYKSGVSSYDQIRKASYEGSLQAQIASRS